MVARTRVPRTRPQDDVDESSVRSQDGYLYAQFKSPTGFDDVEFYLPADDATVSTSSCCLTG